MNATFNSQLIMNASDNDYWVCNCFLVKLSCSLADTLLLSPGMSLPRSWRFSRRYGKSYRKSCSLRRHPWGKGQFHQLVKCLDVKEAIGSPHHHVLKCYDVVIRMEPANRARSFLLCQGTVESDISLASLWFAFDRLCPTVDWVVDFAVVDHCW